MCWCQAIEWSVMSCNFPYDRNKQTITFIFIWKRISTSNQYSTGRLFSLLVFFLLLFLNIIILRDFWICKVVFALFAIINILLISNLWVLCCCAQHWQSSVFFFFSSSSSSFFSTFSYRLFQCRLYNTHICMAVCEPNDSLSWW